MKYGIMALLFLANNEVTSLIALMVMTVFAIYDLAVAGMERGK